MENPKKKASSLRWGILRRALLSSQSSTASDDQSETSVKSISRKANLGFNLIPFHLVDNGQLKLEDSLNTSLPKAREACVCYTLPNQSATELFLYQRVDNFANLDDFRICNTYDIDNTGLVCSWPSEEVLAYYCLSQLDLFRSKKVIELGSGYGLAGLLIAAVTEALEVVISDGNPQVVDYIQRNINANSSVFGSTKVESMMLHWNQEDPLDVCNSFDIIVASDCTFFKEFHKGLVQTVKCLLKKEGPSEAIFLGPKRGNSLDDFLTVVKESGLRFTVDETYDPEIWRHHESFINDNTTWPNYEKDHCYPLLTDYIPSFLAAIDVLQQKLEERYESMHLCPNCVISDKYMSWTGEFADKHQLPRIMFDGMGSFNELVYNNLYASKVLDDLPASEPFVVPVLPERLEREIGFKLIRI